MSTVYFKRQGGGKSSDLTAKAPLKLEYGEPAVDSNGVLYVGNGKGKVVSKVHEAGNGMWLYRATFAVDDLDERLSLFFSWQPEKIDEPTIAMISSSMSFVLSYLRLFF